MTERLSLTEEYIKRTQGLPMADLMASELRECAVLIREPGAIGTRSHLGGTPLLPPDTPWPRDPAYPKRCATDPDAPLSLLAEIFLEDMPHFRGREKLPETGVLQAWSQCAALPWKETDFLVTWYPDIDALVPATPPEDLKDQFRRCSVRMEARVSLMRTCQLFSLKQIPPYSNRDNLNEERQNFARLEAAAVEMAVGEAPPLEDDGMTWAKEAHEKRFAVPDPHQILGHMETIQDERYDPEWQLLFQFGSDDDEDGPGWMWADGGIMWFHIRHDDLAMRRFDKAKGYISSY